MKMLLQTTSIVVSGFWCECTYNKWQSLSCQQSKNSCLCPLTFIPFHYSSQFPSNSQVVTVTQLKQSQNKLDQRGAPMLSLTCTLRCLSQPQFQGWCHKHYCQKSLKVRENQKEAPLSVLSFYLLYVGVVNCWMYSTQSRVLHDQTIQLISLGSYPNRQLPLCD